MMLADRESFFAAAPAPLTEDVAVPGLPPVRVRQITAGERDRFEVNAQGKGMEDLRARVLVACCVNEDGSPMFTYADLPRLSSLPAHVVEPIIETAKRLNAITAKDLDDLEKNSEASP